jgi:hypothetical protein
LRLGDVFDRDERARLSAFLNKDGSLADLTEELCADIRAGRYDSKWDETLDLVLAQTVDKVRIVRPGHLVPEHRDAQSKPQ